MYNGKNCIKEREREGERDIFSQLRGDCFLLRVDYTRFRAKVMAKGQLGKEETSCPSRVETLFGHAVVAEHGVAGSRVALLKCALCVQTNPAYKVSTASSRE